MHFIGETCIYCAHALKFLACVYHISYALKTDYNSEFKRACEYWSSATKTLYLYYQGLVT